MTQLLMKKIILIITFLFSISTFAHELTKKEKRVIYEYINLQLEKGLITQKQAQKMWVKATKCCRGEESS